MLYQSQTVPEFYNISIIEGETENNKIVYATQRSSFQSSFITAYSNNNENQTYLLALYEITIPYKSPQDWLSNLRFPM